MVCKRNSQKYLSRSLSSPRFQHQEFTLSVLFQCESSSMSSRAESSKGLDSKEGRVNEADHDQSSIVLESKKTCFKGVSQLRLMSINQSLSCCKMRAKRLYRLSSTTTSSRTRVLVVCRVRQSAAEAARVNAKPRWSGLELIDSRNARKGFPFV